MDRLLLDLPEVIKTPRLILQIPMAGWGNRLHSAIIDGYEDCIQWLKWPSSKPTQESVERDCRKHHSDFILRDCIRYIILEKDSGNIVGRCAFPPGQTMWDIPQFGVSYFIRKSQRMKGYATEAVHALTLLAFNLLKAKKVEIYCDVENIASLKVPQKLNFQLEYRQKGGWVRHNGELAELCTYSIFSEADLPELQIEW